MRMILICDSFDPMHRTPLSLPAAMGVSLAAVVLLSGCAAPTEASVPAAPSTASVNGDGPADAREVAAPALHLTTVSPAGAISHLNVADGSVTEIGPIPPADHVTTDGRYLFAAREGSVTVVDSGAWTWSHGDHFHYYSGAGRVVGEVRGAGTPTVVTGDRSIGIRFDEGEAVLVKVAPLADGEIEELFRMPVAAGPGAVVPLAYGAWVTESGADGEGLRGVDEDGVAGAFTPCDDPGGTIATTVGVVVACAGGAVLAVDGRPARAEVIDAPPSDTPSAADAPGPSAVPTFTGREGRPTVSALAGPRALWLLDTRARQWHRIDVSEELASAVAVDDDAGHIVAVTTGGSLLVLDEGTGRVLSRTEGVGARGVHARAAVLLADRDLTFVVVGTSALAVDHRTGSVVDEFTLAHGGHTVLTGR